MTELHVAEPQPLWLSLQHTLPSLVIAAAPVEVAGSPAEVVGILVDVADSIVATLAEVKEHIFTVES